MSEATWPIIAASIFGILIIGLIIYILIYQRHIRAREAELQHWDDIAEEVIMEAIFFDDKHLKDPREDALDILEVQKVPVTKQLRALLQDETFRKRLINKIVAAKRNVSGTASENLTRLFRQLDFDIDILRMLSTSVWYNRATALELIGFMKLHDYQHLVRQNVDHRSGLIRMEAQNAVLRFSGFEGLSFLTRTKYPLSEWQQMKLLDELSHLPHEDFVGIEEWLSSENDSVVVFALKLVRIYHRFELFENVLRCLDHVNPEVRFHAISVLKALPNPDAVPVLLRVYPAETTLNKVEILKVLQAIASETEVGFLASQLQDPEIEINLEAVRALHGVGETGKKVLSGYESEEAYPLNRIIAQVKEEQA